MKMKIAQLRDYHELVFWVVFSCVLLYDDDDDDNYHVVEESSQERLEEEVCRRRMADAVCRIPPT